MPLNFYFYFAHTQNLNEELCSENGQVEEIAMILGATPLSPRDVYRFQFPPLLFGHLDSKHPHQSSSLALIRFVLFEKSVDVQES